MPDLSMQIPDIKKSISDKHDSYITKYSKVIHKKMAENEMVRDRTYAKLALIAKIFVDAGVVNYSKEVTVSAAVGSFARSIALSSEFSPLPMSRFAAEWGGQGSLRIEAELLPARKSRPGGSLFSPSGVFRLSPLPDKWLEDPGWTGVPENCLQARPCRCSSRTHSH